MFVREGGSIPVVSTFQEVLGLPSVLFGIGLPGENAHAPNEWLDLGNFHNGVLAAAYLRSRFPMEFLSGVDGLDRDTRRRLLIDLLVFAGVTL